MVNRRERCVCMRVCVGSSSFENRRCNLGCISTLLNIALIVTIHNWPFLCGQSNLTVNDCYSAARVLCLAVCGQVKVYFEELALVANQDRW